MKVWIAVLFAVAASLRLACIRSTRRITTQGNWNCANGISAAAWEYWASNKTAYGGSEAAGAGGYNFGDPWTWAANIDAGRIFHNTPEGGRGTDVVQRKVIL